MVSTVFDPREPKTAWDVVILLIIAAHFAAVAWLPITASRPLLIAAFVFWRAAYDAGLGFLLQAQSRHGTLVQWARKYGVFDRKRSPERYEFIRRQLEPKMGSDYNYDTSPIELNTWLLYRRLVDLVLMCDFVSYILMVVVCSKSPLQDGSARFTLRLIGGAALILFNVWVKLDAHRVVKDYAWYWGDFFFLVDADLTFDGVFEMAPHPMYSVGYAGYYGFSLIAASYTVLFLSLAAHAAQFLFLIFVENPHIDKTYNTARRQRVCTSRRPSRLSRLSMSAAFKPDMCSDDKEVNDDLEVQSSDKSPSDSYSAVVVDDDAGVSLPTSARKDLVVFYNFDPFRATDLLVALLVVFTSATFLSLPDTHTYRMLSVGHALMWRVIHSLGHGIVLTRQSRSKAWTKHFVKYGDGPEEAWRNWRSIYNVTVCMVYVSYAIAAFKYYRVPENWQYGYGLLFHTLGALLIALHVWTSVSIYHDLGDFGWFYGDFFTTSKTPTLTYSGIYRYLNNPERLIGSSAFWGIAFISNRSVIVALATVAQLSNLAFIRFVERPHMQKLYGSQMRQESGFVKTIRQATHAAVPLPVGQTMRGVAVHVDRVMDDTAGKIEELLDRTRPKLEEAVKECSGGLVRLDAFLTIKPRRELSEQLSQYCLQIGSNSGTPKNDGRNGAMKFRFGEPITVNWVAPAAHSRRCWIGMYRLSDNASPEQTRVSSKGRWSAIHTEEFDTHSENIVRSSDTDGEVVFKGSSLFWQTGSYEFRMHADGKHTVVARSAPFDIELDKLDPKDNDFERIEEVIFSLAVACCEDDEQIAPDTEHDEIVFDGERGRVCARRIAYAVKVVFGVELVPEVVISDASVHNLARRITAARQVLAPFLSLASLPKKVD